MQICVAATGPDNNHRRFALQCVPTSSQVPHASLSTLLISLLPVFPIVFFLLHALPHSSCFSTWFPFSSPQDFTLASPFPSCLDCQLDFSSGFPACFPFCFPSWFSVMIKLPSYLLSHLISPLASRFYFPPVLLSFCFLLCFPELPHYHNDGTLCNYELVFCIKYNYVPVIHKYCPGPFIFFPNQWLLATF